MLQDKYAVNQGMVKLSTQLNNGVYFVKVSSSKGTVKQQKVIITKQ